MNKILTLTGIALAVITLAACSPGINEGIGHHITFDSSGMVVHKIGKPDAHIGKDGSLAIDGRAIDATTAQRPMLQRYYGAAQVPVVLAGDTLPADRAAGVATFIRLCEPLIRAIGTGEKHEATN